MAFPIVLYGFIEIFLCGNGGAQRVPSAGIEFQMRESHIPHV